MATMEEHNMYTFNIHISNNVNVNYTISFSFLIINIK